MQVTTGRKRHHGRRHDAARDLGIVNVEELADNEDGIILTTRQGVVQVIVPLVVVHEVKLVLVPAERGLVVGVLGRQEQRRQLPRALARSDGEP